MPEPTVVDRIRHIFLHRRPHVSISTAAELLGWSGSAMRTAIAAGDVVLSETPLGKWVTREELMAKALELWPREVIEEALGSAAEAVLPHAVRLAELRARTRERLGQLPASPWPLARCCQLSVVGCLRLVALLPGQLTTDN